MAGGGLLSGSFQNIFLCALLGKKKESIGSKPMKNWKIKNIPNTVKV